MEGISFKKILQILDGFSFSERRFSFSWEGIPFTRFPNLSTYQENNK